MGKHERQRRRNFKQALGLIVIIVAAIFGYQYYVQAIHDRGTVALWFEDGGKGGEHFRVRVVANDPSRQRGLMFVKAEELEPNRGMLFIFPEERVQSFWMKDTFAPLDMIFVDKNRAVVGVVENAVPFSLEPRKVDKPSIYVVELLAGAAKRAGIHSGLIMKVDGDLPTAR